MASPSPSHCGFWEFLIWRTKACEENLLWDSVHSKERSGAFASEFGDQ
jgi:hypothetical protein